MSTLEINPILDRLKIQREKSRKFIEYPENPNTNVKEKIQALADEQDESRRVQREQRLAYQAQLQELQKAAERAQQQP